MLETKSFLFGIASTCVPVTQKITGFPVCKTIYVSACMLRSAPGKHDFISVKTMMSSYQENFLTILIVAFDSGQHDYQKNKCCFHRTQEMQLKMV